MKKCVVLGVTGSIAAYKAAELVSRLKKRDIDVRVIMTEAATKFVAPLTFETLSLNPAVTDMFSRETPWEVEHIALAKRADVFVVAPASANFIGKFAAGIADDMLTTTVMATKAPVMIAPAMNTNMYESAAVQENIGILRRRGCEFIEPESGLLACGDTGRGRLAEPAELERRIMERLVQKRDLEGMKLLVTAGATREDIDPVRYITNRSSGKMGFAIAEAAARRGAEVTLVCGISALKTPYGVKRIDVVSSDDMFEAVDALFGKCDALVMAAAPADFTPAEKAAQKLKKNGRQNMTLELRATRDILKAMGAKKGVRTIVGFAAETQNIRENALKKLEEKNLDMIAANDVAGENTGFGVDTNAVTLFIRGGGERSIALADKSIVADRLLDELAEYRLNTAGA